METLSIEIINPGAKELILNLESMNLIKIHSDGSIKMETDSKDAARKELLKLVQDLGDNDFAPLSLEEITKEVEIVRKERYEREN